MTIAEIHGKIGRTAQRLTERSEDLLTSDVFGTCRYLEPEDLLGPFLRMAQHHRHGGRLADFLPQEIIHVGYSFWHRLGTCEPDVILRIQSRMEEHQDDTLVLIEAKLFSPKSNREIREEELFEEAVSDQLAIQYEALYKDAPTAFGPEACNSRCLVYVTAHRQMPQAELQESISALQSRNEHIHIYWLNWHELYPILKRKLKPNSLPGYKQLLFSDLLKLLKRKDLKTYDGYAIEKGTPQIVRKYYSNLKSVLPLVCGDIFKGTMS